mgnify:CR=1 FL=1
MNHTKVVRVQKVPDTRAGPAWLGVFEAEDGFWQVVPVGEKLEPPKAPSPIRIELDSGTFVFDPPDFRCWYSQRYMPAQKVLRLLYESRWYGESHYAAADCLTAAGY